MEIFIYLAIICIVFKLAFDIQNGEKKESSSNQDVQDQTIKIIHREETANEIIFIIDDDGTFEIVFHIDKKGSPWVRVYVVGHEEDVYEYNVKNYRWKDGDSIGIYESEKKITKLIREEWNVARKIYNWHFPPPKKMQPVTADISTKNIFFRYDETVLNGLTDRIEIQGTQRRPYIVNLKKLSCTCPDFVKRRAKFPAGDIRRICKHQAKAIIQSKINTKITTDKRMQAIIRTSQEKGFHVFDECIEITFKENIKGPPTFYLFIEKNNDWIDVIIFTERSLYRSGYNIKKNRYAYGNNPFPDGLKRKYTKAIQIALKKGVSQ